MAVQYDDGSISDLMNFHDALTEFLSNPKSKTLHKIKDKEEYQSIKTESKLQEETEKLKSRLDKIEQQMSPVKSSILHIPNDEEKSIIEKYMTSDAISILTRKNQTLIK